ncbi:MAG: DJ-1/PfpI family protein [Bacteroidota bacterium]
MKTKHLISILYCLLVFACQTNEVERGMEEVPSKEPQKILNAAFLIMDGVYNTELTAPMDILQHSKYRHEHYIDVFTVAEQRDTVISFEGLKIIPDYTFSDHPSIDMLIVPSAEHHLDSDLENELMINWVKEIDKDAEWMMSLCDGAFVLAKAGLLEGVNCTTFPSDIDQLQRDFPKLIAHKDVLFVHEGKYITSVGGARSFEPALYLHHLLYGDSLTKKTAGGLVLDWDIQSLNYIRF